MSPRLTAEVPTVPRTVLFERRGGGAIAQPAERLSLGPVRPGRVLVKTLLAFIRRGAGGKNLSFDFARSVP